jgi:hypothetical protein
MVAKELRMKNFFVSIMLGVTLISFKARADIESMQCQIVLNQYDPVNDDETNTAFPMVVKKIDNGNASYFEANGSAAGYDFQAQYYLFKTGDPDYIAMKTTDQKTHISQATSVYAPHSQGTNYRIGIMGIDMPDLSELSEQCSLQVK